MEGQENHEKEATTKFLCPYNPLGKVEAFLHTVEWLLISKKAFMYVNLL